MCNTSIWRTCVLSPVQVVEWSGEGRGCHGDAHGTSCGSWGRLAQRGTVTIWCSVGGGRRVVTYGAPVHKTDSRARLMAGTQRCLPTPGHTLAGRHGGGEQYGAGVSGRTVTSVVVAVEGGRLEALRARRCHTGQMRAVRRDKHWARTTCWRRWWCGGVTVTAAEAAAASLMVLLEEAHTHGLRAPPPPSLTLPPSLTTTTHTPTHTSTHSHSRTSSSFTMTLVCVVYGGTCCVIDHHGSVGVGSLAGRRDPPSSRGRRSTRVFQLVARSLLTLLTYSPPDLPIPSPVHL